MDVPQCSLRGHNVRHPWSEESRATVSWHGLDGARLGIIGSVWPTGIIELGYCRGKTCVARALSLESPALGPMRRSGFRRIRATRLGWAPLGQYVQTRLKAWTRVRRTFRPGPAWADISPKRQTRRTFHGPNWAVRQARLVLGCSPLC